MPSRRTAVIVWCVLLVGVFVLTTVATTIGPGIWPRSGDLGKVLAWEVLGMAPVCLLASRALPNHVKPTPGVAAEALVLGRSIVASGVNGASALCAALAWMVSGKMIAIAALAISLAGLSLTFPSERRWQKLRRTVAVTGGQELVAGANLSAPQPPVSRKALPWWLGLLLALSAAALALGGAMLWTEEALRRGPSPAIRVPLSLILALMLTGFAAIKWTGASASRRPRWQRVHGILLLLGAACLLVQAILSVRFG